MGRIVKDLSLKRAKLSAIAARRKDQLNRAGMNLHHNLPVSLDYLTLNDSVMVPDVGFVKQLKLIDRDLEVVWDWGASKWKIFKFPEDGSEPYHVLTVQTKDRTYKELSSEVLLKLKQSYSMTPRQMVDYIDECNNQVQRRKRKDFFNKIDSIARDTFINIHCKLIQVPRQYIIDPPLWKKVEEVSTDG